MWSVGGTINGDSRKKFDAFFRLLISGTDKDHPKPKNIKLTKVCGSQFSTVSLQSTHFAQANFLQAVGNGPFLGNVGKFLGNVDMFGNADMEMFRSFSCMNVL